MKTSLSVVVLLVLTAVANATPFLQNQVVVQLSHPNAWVQARACYLLGEWGMRGAVPTLTHFVNDDRHTDFARLHAGIALGRLGDRLGAKFCLDVVTPSGDWAKVARREVAQTEFVTMLARRVVKDSDAGTKPVSQKLSEAIDGLWDATNGVVDGPNSILGLEKQVLLDRTSKVTWAMLADAVRSDKRRSAAITAKAKEVSK